MGRLTGRLVDSPAPPPPPRHWPMSEEESVNQRLAALRRAQCEHCVKAPRGVRQKWVVKRLARLEDALQDAPIARRPVPQR